MKAGIIIISVVATAMLGSCGSNKLIGRPGLEVAQNRELPASAIQDFSLRRLYTVGPSDTLNIQVFGAPDLSGKFQVDTGGHLALPLTGDIVALGKTLPELGTAVEALLRGRYVRDPNVTITIEESRQLFTVDGAVQRPGQYPALGRMTLLRAISSGGGTSDYADTNYVVIFRQVGNQQMAGLYDLRAIRSGIYADPEVYPNDVISVGEDSGRRLFQTAIQGAGLLVAPLVAVLN